LASTLLIYRQGDEIMKTLGIIFILTFTLSSFAQEAPSEERNIASVQSTIRTEHAKELLGDRFKRSFISRLDDEQLEIEKHIVALFDRYLPKQYKAQSEDIAHTLIAECMKYEMDPYFIIALIAGESSFKPYARGPVGEIGLMQIRPSTAKWIAGKMKLTWTGKKSLLNPIANIKIGTAYIAWMREKFDNHAQLYLAAYNMGRTNVKRALSKNVWPKDYPIHVMKRYFALYKGLQKNVAKI
jgi:soluble lytic murein transglycosylase